MILQYSPYESSLGTVKVSLIVIDSDEPLVGTRSLYLSKIQTYKIHSLNQIGCIKRVHVPVQKLFSNALADPQVDGRCLDPHWLFNDTWQRDASPEHQFFRVQLQQQPGRDEPGRCPPKRSPADPAI